MNDEIRCAVELRADDTRQGPGRLVGRILRYGERALDRAELFEAGAFDLDAIKAAGGVILNRQHARGAPIMRVIPESRGGRTGNQSGTPGHASGP